MVVIVVVFGVLDGDSGGVGVGGSDSGCYMYR